MKFLVERIRELPHKKLILEVTVILCIFSTLMIPIRYERSVEYEVTYGYLRTADDGSIVGCVVIKNVDEYGGTFTVKYRVLEIFGPTSLSEIFCPKSSPSSLSTGEVSDYVGPGEEKAFKFRFYLSRNIHIDSSFGAGPPALIVFVGRVVDWEVPENDNVPLASFWPPSSVVEYAVHISSEIEPPTITVTEMLYKPVIELSVRQYGPLIKLSIHQFRVLYKLIVRYLGSIGQCAYAFV